MFKSTTYTHRRTRLQNQIQSGLILIMGNHEVGMNYTANTYRFRQDSNFLYFFGLDIPVLAGLIDVDNDKTTIFGNELTMEDVVWEGGEERDAQANSDRGNQTLSSLKDMFSDF